MKVFALFNQFKPDMLNFTSVSVLVFFAFSLIIPSGYSVGALLLVIIGVVVFFNHNHWPKLSRDDLLVITVLVFFGCVWFLDSILSGLGVKGIDKPIRYFLAALALVGLIRYPPNAKFLWLGVGIGALLTGFFASWQKFYVGYARADGFTYVIQFGNLSMLLGLLCISGIGWAAMQRNRAVWIVMLLLGFAGGFLGSIFSGSRGGWIGLPFVALVLYQCYKPWLPLIRVAVIGSLFMVLLGAVYMFPQTGVNERIDQAFSDVKIYADGEASTSLGTRFELWKGAWMMIQEKPVFGHGAAGYIDKLNDYVNSGLIQPGIISHAHNEYLDITAKRGAFGLISLLLLYFIPLRLFIKHTKTAGLEQCAAAAAGAVLCVAFMDFGLSQVFLLHNSGTMVFSFSLVIIWSVVRGYELSGSKKRH